MGPQVEMLLCMLPCSYVFTICGQLYVGSSQGDLAFHLHSLPVKSVAQLSKVGCPQTDMGLGLDQLVKFLMSHSKKYCILVTFSLPCRMLRFLNLEGNQLAALPCSFLKLRNLRSLRVYNNFMHPLFWRENSQNNPQVSFS